MLVFSVSVEWMHLDFVKVKFLIIQFPSGGGGSCTAQYLIDILKDI